MAEAEAPISGSEKPPAETVPVIPAAGGPLQLSGLTLISLGAGALAMVAGIVVAVSLTSKMGDSVTLGALLAGLVLAIAAVVCGSVAIDRARDTLLPHRDRLVMLGGPVMAAVGLTVPVFAWCILQASISQPDPVQTAYTAPIVVPVDVAPAAATVPVAPPAPAPAAAGGLAPLPAPGAEAPKAGDAAAPAPLPVPAPGAEAPKAGDAAAPAPLPVPAPGAEAPTPKAGDAATAPLPVPGDAPKAGGDAPKTPDAPAPTNT